MLIFLYDNFNFPVYNFPQRQKLSLNFEVLVSNSGYAPVSGAVMCLKRRNILVKVNFWVMFTIYWVLKGLYDKDSKLIMFGVILHVFCIYKRLLSTQAELATYEE